MINYLSFKTRLYFVLDNKLQVMAVVPRNNIFQSPNLTGLSSNDSSFLPKISANFQEVFRPS